jgi:elongation factor Ts
MAEITAKLVNDLRSKTGQGMMECKRALAECGGDMEKALDYFRKKGVKASLAERAATEGRVVGVVTEDRRAGALVEINTNTDFTAKNETVLKVAAKAAKLLAHNPDADVINAAEVSSELTSVAQTTGENVRIGRAVRLDLDRSGVPADVVAKEKEIAVEQAKATGKPQQIAEKIAEGKLNAWFAERVLLDQEFFNAQVFKGNVANYLKQNNVGLTKYVRVEVGQA